MSSSDEYNRRIASGAYKFVLGADEMGYGSWAGPLYVCAAVVPVDWRMRGINDSKKLTLEKREELFYWLRTNAKLKFEVATADVAEIDENGLGAALKRCYLESIGKLQKLFPDALVVVDGEVQLKELKYIHFPRADGAVPAVMAASVYGKVLRDRVMADLGKKYPGYGLGDHAGYGTEEHEAALRKKGMSEVHRKYTPMDRIREGKRGKNKPVAFDDDVELF